RYRRYFMQAAGMALGVFADHRRRAGSRPGPVSHVDGSGVLCDPQRGPYHRAGDSPPRAGAGKTAVRASGCREFLALSPAFGYVSSGCFQSLLPARLNPGERSESKDHLTNAILAKRNTGQATLGSLTNLPTG